MILKLVCSLRRAEDQRRRDVQKTAQSPATGCWVRLHTAATQGPLLFSLPGSPPDRDRGKCLRASPALQSIPLPPQPHPSYPPSPLTQPQATPQIDLLVAPSFIPDRSPEKLGPSQHPGDLFVKSDSLKAASPPLTHCPQNMIEIKHHPGQEQPEDRQFNLRPGRWLKCIFWGPVWKTLQVEHWPESATEPRPQLARQAKPENSRMGVLHQAYRVLTNSSRQETPPGPAEHYGVTLLDLSLAFMTVTTFRHSSWSPNEA